MSQFEILGPNRLKGEIPVLGAKNAAMKMIAASVLISGKVVLDNVPDILDIQTIINILTENGAKIVRDGHRLEIDTETLHDIDPNPELVKKMRGSIVLMGPYLARFGKISIPHPGGCVIGKRPIDIHLEAFQKLGAEIIEQDNTYHLKIAKFNGGEVHFKKISVTATENVLMASCKANGTTKIFNAAREPEIVDLAEFLNACGAKISGAGTSNIIVQGVDSLHGVNYKVIPDRIEAGTFIILALVTKSQLKIVNCNPNHLTAFLNKLRQIGAKFTLGNYFIEVYPTENLKATEIETREYPGFPTDLQAPFGLLATQCNGVSRITENIHDNRLNYLTELEKMGARQKIVNNRLAQITGPSELLAAHIKSLDLRAGATMILAALAADGKTIIDDIEVVDRGYEEIEKRLIKIGAKIKRIGT